MKAMKLVMSKFTFYGTINNVLDELLRGQFDSFRLKIAKIFLMERNVDFTMNSKTSKLNPFPSNSFRNLTFEMRISITTISNAIF